MKINDIEIPSTVSKIAMKLAMLSTELDFRVANDGKKINQLAKETNNESVAAQLCMVLKVFSESIRSKDKLRNSEIIETAALILSEYKHESIEDILMAFKRSKLRGDVFYAGLEVGKIFDLINIYLSEKSEWREHLELNKKSLYLKKEHWNKLDGLTEHEFKENMKAIQNEIRIAAGKVVPVSTGENYFDEKILEILPGLSLEELNECKKSFENQSLYDPERFKKQIDLINMHIEARKEL